MNVHFLNPFVEAVFFVLESELDLSAQKGNLSLLRSANATDDVTVLIYMAGRIEGVVLYGMAEDTAKKVVSKIMGEPFAEFNELAQSGIAELANVITGQAGIRLADAGYESRISPPSLILGKNVLISTLDFDRLLVPIHTDFGDLNVHLALRDTLPTTQPQ